VRILHLLASPFFSGPAQLVTELALAQRALGHEVTVAVDLRRRTTPAEELAQPRLEQLALLDRGGLELSVKSSPFQVLRDVRTLHHRKVDVIHAHFSHDHFLLRLARPAGAARIRSVHALRSLRGSLPAADGFTVPVEGWLERLPLGAPRTVLPALVGEDFHPVPEARTQLGLQGTPLIGMVSTFQPSRRHPLGIAAFARLQARVPGARLVLVGDGKLEPQLRAQVAQAGLSETVIFAGYQQGPDFVRWLSALDEVWILGLGNDFSARAAAQARCCGVRVVAADEGALARYADVVVPALSPETVVAASRSGARRRVEVPRPEQIAREVLALYEQARDRRAHR